MYLELAESPRSFPVKAYSRKANKVRSHRRRFLSEDEGAEADNPYIFIPDFSGETSGYYVREDYFDFMDADEFGDMMEYIAAYQPAVQQGAMSEDYFLASKVTRKARREARKNARVEKKVLKNEKKQAKIALKNAKAEGIASGTWQGGSGKEIFSSVLGTVKGIFGHGDEEDYSEEDYEDGGIPNANQSRSTPDDFWDRTVFGVPNKIVVPVAAAVVIGGGIYLANRRRRRRAA